LTRTVRSRTYGTIPAAVASVCTLTWFCAQGNIRHHEGLHLDRHTRRGQVPLRAPDVSERVRISPK
jgi:hypothetical protein